MGIFGALNTAVTGLRAQAYALENISGNIANSQTTGFKRIDTSFQDLIPDTGARMQLAGSVLASSRNTNTVQGDIQNSSVSTFMAINGDGFFAVQQPANFVDNRPIFDGVNLYTRRGDFQTDKNGFLVNGSGYYLMGVPIDPATGNAVGSVPEMLQFKNDFLPAQPTTQIEYRANLAKVPLTQNAIDNPGPQAELIDATTFTVNPLVAGTGTVVANDVPNFLKQTISGGALTAYDEAGAATNVQLRWGKTDAAAYGGTDTWELFYLADPDATGAGVAWRNAGAAYSFGSDGKMNPAVNNVTLTGMTVNGIALGDVSLVHGIGGMTQFSDPNGSAQVNQIQQNGFPAGDLQSIAISDKGRLTGTYSNGRTIDLAAISIATFNGPEKLRRLDGGAFAATEESGPALFNNAGSVIGSALEGSNTDIADEFTKLIVTQQAYSANTRVVSTSNEMVQDLLNMLR